MHLGIEKCVKKLEQGSSKREREKWEEGLKIWKSLNGY